MFTFRNFNIADWFSFYRIFAAPFLLVLLILQERVIFTILPALAGDCNVCAQLP